MAVLSVVNFTRAGTVIDGTGTILVDADAGGDEFANTGKEVFFVTNNSGGSITVTLVFKPGINVDGQTPANRTVTIVDGAITVIGPFPNVNYNDTDGRMNVTYSDATDVTVAVMKLAT